MELSKSSYAYTKNGRTVVVIKEGHDYKVITEMGTYPVHVRRTTGSYQYYYNVPARPRNKQITIPKFIIEDILGGDE